jgi:beta-lactamase superfamily II metal-dependent hydrolase
MQLKDQDAGLGIQALCSMLDTYNHPLTANTAIDDIVYRNYYNRYPVGFEDENNLSMVTFFDFGRNKVCYTGDMTRKGWLKLMENPAFLAELPSTSIFFASHHGRQDGCCDELYSIGQLKPTITIISDSGIQHATQETVQWYRARSIGFELNGSVRRVLTTRRDGNISMLIAADGAIEVYTQVAY